MSNFGRVLSALVVGLVALAILAPAEPFAQVTNPYRAQHGWAKAGRTMGVSAGVYQDPQTQHMWVMDRCGGNNCAAEGIEINPFLKFDMDGNLVTSFGKGIFGWPHGFFVDYEGNIWGTEGGPVGEGRGQPGFKEGKGHQVHKFSQDGKLLMSLGVANVAGDDETHFNGPSHVAVAPDTGDIWITDGHRGGNNRLVRFDRNGKFKMQIGGGVDSATSERGLFRDPHHIAFDSEGRIYISDRGNNRVQIFDKEGQFLAVWTQFGRPSSIAFDANDNIYVVDGTSNPGSHPGWEKGIRIGDSNTGWVKYMIPEVETLDPESGRTVDAEFIGVDDQGSIYSGEVAGRKLVKWVLSPWYSQESGAGILNFRPVGSQ